MGVLVARTGRELQRYTATGGREVVGSVPTLSCDFVLGSFIWCFIIRVHLGTR